MLIVVSLFVDIIVAFGVVQTDMNFAPKMTEASLNVWKGFYHILG
jgi:hypothetical protein